MQITHQPTDLSWQGREVVREIDDRPHLLVRIDIRDGHFPQRAPVPFARIAGRRERVDSWFAEIAEDERTLHAYFPTDVPRSGVLEFGYGATVMGRVSLEFREEAVRRLERERLPKEVVRVSRDLLLQQR